MSLTRVVTRRSSRGVRAILAAIVASTAAGDARADEKDVCVRAVEHAQVVRLDGKLREARDGFVTCARPVCPEAIRLDCTRWLTEVEASLPSVVFEAVWADGTDVTGMTVLVDGKPLAGAERGRAIPIDPGEHTFRFEVPGAAPIETRNVIREGEKNRILRETFTPATPVEQGPPAPAPAGATAPAAPPSSATAIVPAPAGLWQAVPEESPRPARRASIPVASFVLGGVAIGGFVGFAVLGLAGTHRLDEMRSTCVHSCNPGDVSSARNQILAGDILGYVGLAAAGIATWLALTHHDAPSSSPSPP